MGLPLNIFQCSLDLVYKLSRLSDCSDINELGQKCQTCFIQWVKVSVYGACWIPEVTILSRE